jgi:hypothetical protein
MITELQRKGITFKLTGETLKVVAPIELANDELKEVIKKNKEQLICELRQQQANLNFWFHLIRQATTKEEVFRILDDFRPLKWSDEQRASISRWYNGRLDFLRSLEHKQ